MGELRRDQLLPSSTGDEGISPQEHHEWAVKLWRRMDRDGNGSISHDELDCEEFRSIIKSVIAPSTGRNMGGPRYARAQMNMDQALKYFLRKADCNMDGSVSFQEFKSFMYTLRKGSLDSADMIFALFDLDSDQTIDEEEFREIYRFFSGHAPHESEFQEEWGRLDVYNTGSVTRSQYMTWLKQSENPIFKVHRPAEQSRQDVMERFMASGSLSDPFELQKDKDAWRPWHSYGHFAWNDPSKGKPSHTKMKFRDTSRSKTSHSLAMKSIKGSPDFRPPWNDRLATSNPNWPTQDGKPRQVVGRRQFFSRPQSLPELRRHLEAQPRLREHADSVFSAEAPRQRSVLSHERDGSDAQLLSVSSRDKPGGSMRHPWTRERTKWNQHFLSPPQLRDHFNPPPATAIGAPPDHLYKDLYDEEF